MPGFFTFILSDLAPIGDGESFLHPQRHLIVAVDTEPLTSAQAPRTNPVTCAPAITAGRFKRAGGMEVLGIDTTSLPIIWDADFLYGPRTASGEDSYVLCEDNVSSVFAIPDQAPAAIAHLTLSR